MFGSIAAKSIDNRPPPDPAKALDPWDDTSLIQFWQQSIGSYKKHHAGPDTIDEKGPDPLVERSKRMDSSIPDDQTTRTKRARKDTVDPTTTAATDNLPSIPAQTTQNTSPLRQDKDDNDDDDDTGPDQVVEEEYSEEYTKAAEDQEHNEDYYGESSYDYNYDYYYYHNNNDYAYQQPQAAAPPPMPFAPPASASPEGNEAFTNMIMAWYYSGYYTGLYQIMKFAKQMETEATELPVNWRPYLIKYRSLKKSLHSVVEELQSRGLSLQLLSDQRQENWSLVYAVTGDTKNQPRPCIKIRVDNPASFSLDDDDIMHQVIPSILATNATDPKPFQYQIDLIKDMEFFRLLLAELEQALTLYDVERQRLLSAVKDLEDLLTIAASPTKKDLYIWREIFHLYLSICPAEKTTQDYEGCKERLALLSNDIVKRKLVSRE
ncbi:hypothetical protein [Absidia glauca]|uniref:SPX domain-containing protein n=1 Tax=Absidia glauca TaxID=4829 RepID=A0A163J3H2_ABSGL|nr:hypothetical protein [Absidia glauca]